MQASEVKHLDHICGQEWIGLGAFAPEGESAVEVLEGGEPVHIAGKHGRRAFVLL